MSLYNLMHGYEPTAKFVITLLFELNGAGIPIPRFRDAYVTYADDSKTKAIMVLLTRTGGNNRDDFIEENKVLRLVPGYINDVDDTFDSTFALFRYDLPEQFQEAVLAHLLEYGEPLSLHEKTMQAIGPDQTRRQKVAMEDVGNQLMTAISNLKGG